ncbi:hypothetical protein G7A66_03625 [Altererythrobacter sp. SALINAS58]|uniref:hypothetical protein n=1 Tax=Alteripontixanthobacter muriae TaxID=2705546 RepID=UPI001575E441|nr:hypothetical protein [Alteripontixanthobacter muriae]NTZ42196.1 hypothetical protein [Alteripontixanthobacter muriae]
MAKANTNGIAVANGDRLAAPLGGTRAQAMQRLQVGVAGLIAMLLLIGLASIITQWAEETGRAAVPEAVATVAAPPAPTSDPLADAGVVPDMPAGPTPAPTTVPSPLTGAPIVIETPGDPDAERP